MKRIVVLMMTVLLLAFGIASADSVATVTSDADNTTVGRGDTIVVTVVLEDSENIKSILFKPVYDSDVFEVVSGEWLLTGAMLSDFDMEKGNAAIAFTNETNPNGEAFTFTLKVKDTAAIGESTISTTAVLKNGSTEYSSTSVDTVITIECSHSYSTDWNYDSSKHWHECSVCGDEKDSVAHVFDNACDTTCNTCGYERTITHNYEDAWSSDDTKHWHECSVCGNMKDEASHEGGSSTCSAKAICDICGSAYGDYAECIFVQEEKEEFLKSEATCVNKAVYYVSCSVCGEAGTENFEVGEVDADNHAGETEVKDAVAKTCTTDGYTGDTYCKDCGELISQGKVDAAGHTLVKVEAKEATHEADGNIEYYECSLCGKLFADETMTEEIALEDTIIAKGEHDYSEDYSSDAENHWKECECGSKIDEAAHEFGDWTVTKEATATEDGSQERTCDVCGYAETEVIKALGSSDEDNKTPVTGDGISTWIALIFVSALCVVGATLYAKRSK